MPNRPITACGYIDKGGVGKTTSIGHFGVALAEEGYDVLLIDLAGKQGDLAKLFGIVDEIDPEDWPNISTVFQPEWERVVEQLGDDAIDQLIHETAEGVDLIPAHQGLDSLDIELESKYSGPNKYNRLDEFITEFISGRYDVVLIDLPGMANNITYNGVWAAQHVLTPVEAGSFEADQARALQYDLQKLSDGYDRDVSLEMIIPNKIDMRTKLARRYLEQYEDEFGDALAPEPVPMSQDIRNATENGQTIFALEEPSGTAKEAIDAYRSNARALVDRV